MKRLAFVLGALALGVAATAPARADFAVVKFKSGYCRVWSDSAAGPQDGKYLWFRHHHHWHHWHYRFHTWAAADKHMHWAAAHHRCDHWLP
jgi:hypothetical protein